MYRCIDICHQNWNKRTETQQQHTSMRSMSGLLRDTTRACSLKNYCKKTEKDIGKLRKEMDQNAERRQEAKAAEEAAKDAAMLRTRVDKCIAEKTKVLQQSIESEANKQQQDTLSTMMSCLMTGIRRICRDSVMGAFCRAKTQAGENKIRKMLKKCAEKCAKGGRPVVVPAKSKEKQPRRNRYTEKLEQCMAREWRDVCESSKNFSPEEKAEMVRMHQCLSDQIKQSCRRKVIKEMCIEAGMEHPRDKAKARKACRQKKAKKTAAQKQKTAKGNAKAKQSEGCSSPEVEKCVDAKLQSVQSFIKSLSENDNASLEDVCGCARIMLRKKCEAEMQQRKCAQQEAAKCRANAERAEEKCHPKEKGGAGGAATVVDQELLQKFRECLFKKVGGPHDIQPGRKVTIVGAGAVGMGCAMALLCKGVTNHMALFDAKQDWMAAERLDLLHGSLFVNNPLIEQCTGMEATKDSRVVVVTAGARPTGNETRLDVAQKTADIVREVMPALLEQSPKATFIIVSNPADVMAWVARKVTNLPYERCLSTGCHLDTARFRLFIGQLLGIATRSVHGFVVGEHGGSSVPLWSTVSVGGVRLQEILPVIGTARDPMYWSTVHKDVVEAAFKVIADKGYTNWAIGLTVADIVAAIFEDSNRVLSLSTNVQGICGITDEVFMSMPCVVCAHGIGAIVRPHLSDWEKQQLQKSVKVLLQAQSGIKI
ncbi:L-lactate dehydrogenase A-like 6B [Drosophila obscura]|uniref:L-lactate dehydrogenase A-like 6B n=1 Tax=Drosophila obscura TaxID=7282 RepID=UPI001BB20E8D|nr:L-lactate dehydrogenase A-like 6B [Drosophila obscura]